VRVNERIRAPQVRLISAEGKQIEDIGVVEVVPKLQGKDLSMLIVPK